MGIEEVSLDEMLLAKEKRVAYYEYLQSEYGGTIVSYNLNIPGPIKSSEIINKIFEAGLNAWNSELSRNNLSMVVSKTWYQKTGPEYFAVLKDSPLQIKRLTTKLEEEHSLGRLFDFDIIDKHMKSYSRSQIGKEPRKCLICNNDAFQCGRSRAHGLDTLLNKINEIAIKSLN